MMLLTVSRSAFRLLHLSFMAVAQIFRTARQAVLMIALAISIAVNVATFATNSVGRWLVGAIESVTLAELPPTRLAKAEKRLVLAARKIALTEGKLLTAIRAKATLEVRLARAVAQVSRQSLRLAKARSDAGAAFGKLVGLHIRFNALQASHAQVLREGRTLMLNGKKMTERAVVSAMTRAMKTRGATWAANTLGAAVGQAVPYYGAAVVVGATAYDLQNMCEMMRDADALETAFNPGAKADGHADKVCGMRPPTMEEVLQAIKHSPTVVWDAVKATPGLAWDSAAAVAGALSGAASSASQQIPDIGWPEW